MSDCNLIVIPDNSVIKIISKSSPTMKKALFIEKEYGLKENIFDPSKNSPPNFFMSKLQQRMSVYGSLIKEDNFNNE
jgi:hypothetical protein